MNVCVCECLCGCADSMDGCSTDCNGNGECVAGHCHCFAGFLGPDCAKGKRYLIKDKAAIGLDFSYWQQTAWKHHTNSLYVCVPILSNLCGRPICMSHAYSPLCFFEFQQKQTSHLPTISHLFHSAFFSNQC